MECNLKLKGISFLFFSFLFLNNSNAQLIEVLNGGETSGLNYSNNLVNNLIGENYVLETKFVEIKDIIERQNQGQLEFTISDFSLEAKILKAQDVDYTNSNQYIWSGNTQDDSFSATFIKDKNGYSGSLYDYSNRYLYRIFPVTPTVSAIIKMDNTENPPTCCAEPVLPPEGEPIVEICNDTCPSHIDILFLLRPDMQDWIVDEGFTITYLNLLVAELNLAFANSKITHSIGFDWVELDWQWDGADGSTTDLCGNEIIDLKNDNEVNMLRSQYGGDIVVMLRADEDRWPTSKTEGCISSVFLELDASEAFIILDAPSTLREFTFVHEVGHSFGAQHQFLSPSSNLPNDTYCSYAHQLVFPNGSGSTGTGTSKDPIQTVMRSGTGELLHFSDPGINFCEVATGLERVETSNSVFPARNNAGKIRSTGCIVANFQDSPSINGAVNWKRLIASLS